MLYQKTVSVLLLAVTLTAFEVNAFSLRTLHLSQCTHHDVLSSKSHLLKNPKSSSSLFKKKSNNYNSLHQLNSASLPSPTSSSRFSLRQLVIRFINIFRKVLYPQTIAPKSTTNAPLAEAAVGCPFFGSYIFAGDSKHGPGKFWRYISQKLNHPGIFNAAFLGRPMTIVYGLDNMKNVLDREFKSAEDGGIVTGQTTSSQAANELFGVESLLRSQDKSEHSWLRKLVGQSMNPGAVAESIPRLVKGAELALEDMISKGSTKDGVVMEDVCTQYTLDVAWRQILGLSLSKDEESVFRDAVGDWIIGIINPLLMMVPSFMVKYFKSYKARKYLDKLILSKIDDLNQNGPDGSTLSAMVYATDDEDGKSGVNEQKLSQTQILDNALLLILAGSETSASTLTTAMMFLGLYPDIYQNIQKEQRNLQEKYGHDQELTKQMLDEMTYLDAFIRETTRIKPLNAGAPRLTKDTIVVDGKQIPKEWTVICNVMLTHSLDPKTVETDGLGNNMDINKGFKPERWLDEETKPSAWMAFGYGPRFCLGYNLAIAEMKVFLALVARNVEFSLINGTEDIKWQKMSIIPKPKDGTLISVETKN